MLHVGKDIPVTLALRQLIEKSFPEEYQQRRQEEQAAADMSDSGEAPLPLFVMSCCLPSELRFPLYLTRLLVLPGAAPLFLFLIALAASEQALCFPAEEKMRLQVRWICPRTCRTQ